MASTNSAITYESRIAAEIAIFKDDEVVHGLPAIFHYWSNKYLVPKVQPFGFASPDDFFIKNLAASLDRKKSDHYYFISIGSGNCDTEVRVASGLVALGYRDFSIECLDLNADMLSRGNALAKANGVEVNITQTAGDFNLWKPAKNYHAVIANQSLHHVLELESLFAAVKQAIEIHQGEFIIADMIGRNGHQRWPEALDIIEQFWQELPDTHKYNHLLKQTEEKYVNWDCSNEGFEGIRAQDILPLLFAQFHFDLFCPFANVIAPFIDRCFGPNFDVNSVNDTNFIDRIHARDELEMQRGKIKPTQMFAVLSNDMSRETRQIEHLSPEFCIRR